MNGLNFIGRFAGRQEDESTFTSRFSLLDGTRGRQTDITHQKGGYLECGLLGCGDAHR